MTDNLGATIVRCMNSSMYMKMSTLVNIIREVSPKMRMENGMKMDAAVLTEMITMGTISLRCNHTASECGGITAYERPRVPDIPSFIEEMHMPMTMPRSNCKKMKFRHNPVTAAILSDAISILEFMERFEQMSNETGTIIMDGSLSVMHAATVACIFECINTYSNWGSRVKLNILTDGETMRAMDAYVGPRTNVLITICSDKMIYMNRVVNMPSDDYVTIVTHNGICSEMLMSMDLRANLDVNMIIAITSVRVEQMVQKVRTKMDMLVEMCPCTDSSLNMVRIIPVHRSENTLGDRIMIRRKQISMFGYMRWYTVMIRRMGIDTICYDCGICLMFARALLAAMTGRDLDMTTFEERKWSERFVGTVRTNDLVN